MTPAQITRVLKMLELLRVRESVSMTTLVRESGVSQRSVFRYLRAIQEADIPVKYDRDAEAYRLYGPRGRTIGQPSLNDVSLIIFALDLLSLHTAGGSQEMIAATRDELIRRHPTVAPGALESFRSNVKNLLALPDLTHALLMAQINVAIEMGKAVEIVARAGDSDEISTRLRHPRVNFTESQWWLGDAENDRCYRLRDLVSVKIDASSDEKR